MFRIYTAYYECVFSPTIIPSLLQRAKTPNYHSIRSLLLWFLSPTIKSIGTCQKDTQNQDKKRKTIRRSQATCDKKITPRCLCVLVYGEPTGEWMNEEKRGSQVGRLLVNIARAAAIIIIITIFGGLYSYPALPCPALTDMTLNMNWGAGLSATGRAAPNKCPSANQSQKSRENENKPNSNE